MPSMVLGPLRDDREQNPADWASSLLDGLSPGWAVGPGLSFHYCPVLGGSSWAEASLALTRDQHGLDPSSYTLF